MEQKHDSYGIIRTKRIHGGGSNLVASRVNTERSILLEIVQGEMTETYGEKRITESCGQNKICSVELSTQQWADFLSSMDIHSGTPCTVRFKDGHSVEQPPEGSDFSLRIDEMDKQIETKLHDITDTFKSKIEDIQELLLASKVSKSTQQEILSSLHRLNTELTTNLPFLAKVLHEGIEKNIQAARNEINSYVADTMTVARNEIRRMQNQEHESLITHDILKNEGEEK